MRLSGKMPAAKCVAFVLTAMLAVSAAGPLNTCVPQQDNAAERFKISTLHPLYGRTMSTAMNGNIYVVSICHTVPSYFYDPRKFVGAMKFTPAGDPIVLGHIHHTKVVIDETNIYLLYNGTNEDQILKDECKGKRWQTSVKFSCDPSATDDVLTFIEEDSKHPEICQVHFEVKTNKTCDQQKNFPKNELEKNVFTYLNHQKPIGKEMNSNYEKEEENSNRYFSQGIHINNNNDDLSDGRKIPFYENRESGSGDINLKNELSYGKRIDLNEKHYNTNEIKHEHLDDEGKNKFLEIGNINRIKYKNALEDDRNKAFLEERKKVFKDNENEKDTFYRNNNKNSYSDYKPFERENPDMKNTFVANERGYSKKATQEEKLNNNEIDKSSKNEEPLNKQITENYVYKKNIKPTNSEYERYESFVRDKKSTNNLNTFDSKHIDSEIISVDNKAHDFVNDEKSTDFGNREHKSHKNNLQNSDYEPFINRYLNKESQTKYNENGNLNHMIQEQNSPNNEIRNTGRFDKPFDGEDKNNILINPANESPNYENINIDKNDLEKQLINKKNINSEKQNGSVNNANKNGDLNLNHFQDESFVNKSDNINDNGKQLDNEVILNPSIKLGKKTFENENKSSVQQNNDTEIINKSDNIAQNGNLKNETLDNDNKSYNNNNNSSETKAVDSTDNKSVNNTSQDESSSNLTNTTETLSNSTIQSNNTINFTAKPIDNGNESYNSNDHNNNSSETKVVDSTDNKSVNNTSQNESSSNLTNTTETLSNSTTQSNNTINFTAKPIDNGNESYNSNDHNNNSSETKAIDSTDNKSVNNMSQDESSSNLTNTTETLSNSTTQSNNTINFTAKPIDNGNESYNSNDHNNNSSEIKVVDSTDNKSVNNTSQDESSSNLTNTTETLSSNSTTQSTNIIAKPIEKNESNTNSSIIKNQSSETNVLPTKKSGGESNSYEPTNNEVENNGTNSNDVINVNTNTKTDQSQLDPSLTNSDASSNSINNQNNNNANLNTTDSSSQSNTTTNFFGFFSKIFPNGISLSATTILGGLGFITVIFGTVGTAINRYYYGKTGSDQIPFKKTYNNIITYIKSFFSRCFGIGNSETSDNSNERTPLLQPKNVTEPTVESETSQNNEKDRKSDDDDNDSYQGGGSTSNNGNVVQSSTRKYGSTSNENRSPVSEKKQNLKNQDTDINESSPRNGGEDQKSIFKTELSQDEKKKSVDKTEQNYQGPSKSIDNETIANTKVDSTLNKSNVSSLSKELESSIENNEPNIDETNKDTINDSDDIFLKVNVKKQTASPKISENLVKDKLLLEETLTDKSLTNVSVEKEEADPQIKNNGIDKVSTSGTNIVNKSKTLISGDSEVVEEQSNKLHEESRRLSTDLINKKNEIKYKFLGFESETPKEIKGEQTEVADESLSQEKELVDNDDESEEVIEEVIYVNAADGEEEGEEIIEEIIETSTAQVPPGTSNSESSDPNSSKSDNGHTIVTVRKSVRKISSNSTPDEVIATEETVYDNGQETDKKAFGLKLGIGKSGLNFSVGDKKLGIGKSGVKFGKQESKQDDDQNLSINLDKTGLKFNRNKHKSSKLSETEVVDESDVRDVVSPGKPKKSKSLSNLKIFKKSISQPAESNIQEDENESSPEVVGKKSNRSSSLLKFGKSRSKSVDQYISYTDDVTTDSNLMTSFIDQERYGSQLSNIGLGELEETNEGNVIRRKISVTKTIEGSNTSPIPLAQEAAVNASDFVFKKFGNALATAVENVEDELVKRVETRNEKQTESLKQNNGMGSNSHLGAETLAVGLEVGEKLGGLLHGKAEDKNIKKESNAKSKKDKGRRRLL